eukprot:15444797-Alexandrium_andersonii.AAC.1
MTQVHAALIAWNNPHGSSLKSQVSHCDAKCVRLERARSMHARNHTQHSVDDVARWLKPCLGAQATSTHVPWITKR